MPEKHHSRAEREEREEARRLKRRGRAKGRSQRGRWWVVVIFCVFRVEDAVTYFLTMDNQRAGVLGPMISHGLWVGALLFGIWRRQNWCRNVLAGFLVLSVAMLTMMIPFLTSMVGFNYGIAIFVGTALAHAGMAWVLVFSPDIKRLTNKHRGLDLAAMVD